MFDYDWFYRGGLARLREEAKARCARRKYGGDASANHDPGHVARHGELETRVILYLKDGLTYEMREMAELGTTSTFAFECVPVDDNYKVGAIVLVVPFEDIARVEVFAVHPDDKPQDNIRIPGFRSAAERDRE